MSVRPYPFVFLSVLAMLGSLVSCGDGAEKEPAPAKSLLDALLGLGLPPDYAQFFADAGFRVTCADELTCTIVRTYPNGATREILLTATRDQTYTPTDAELELVAGVDRPVFDARFTATDIDEDSVAAEAAVELGFFVPNTSLPARGQGLRWEGPIGGFQFNWSESGKKGADVAIGTLLEHYKDVGKVVESTGSIYAVASALSDIAEAMKISREVSAWLAELDVLEKCATDPTNPLTRSDPDYAARTAARVRNARAELKELSAVRFLNQIDDTAMGLTPVSAVLGIGLKQAIVWNETTLKSLSEQLMNDARASVVSCKPACPSAFSATGISESAISLTWVNTAIGSTVTTFTLAGGNASGATTTETDYLDGGLEKSTTYCYGITASNDYGVAEECPQACGTTKGPPRVESTEPVSDETDVAVDAQLTATFSEEVDAATVTGSTFFLSGPGGTAAASVSTNGKVVTLAPAGELAYDTRYTATLTTGVEDLGGTPMEMAYSWSFTTEAAPAEGNLEFEINLGDSIRISGIADVTWTKFEDTGDVRRYVPSGTFTADFIMTDCDPVFDKVVPIEATVPNGPGYTLVVYTATNAAFPKRYQFGLAGDPSFSFNATCYDSSGKARTVPLVGSLINVAVGLCSSGFVPFTDEAMLAGSYSCPESGLVSASWDFSQ